MKKEFDTTIIEKNKKSRRIWELDFLRGVCILLMVMDHTFFDVAYLFNKAWMDTGNQAVIDFVNFTVHYWNMPLRTVTREIVIWTLFMICGISNSFSRSNLKRGIQLMAFAMIITLVTVYLDNNMEAFQGIAIRFGVLHMLASCILIWVIIDTIFRDTYKTAAACFSVAIIILCLYPNMDHLTAGLNITTNNWGFIHENFAESLYDYSAGDYFPLIPNLGIFMIGAAIGPVIYRNRKSLLSFLDKFNWYRPVNFFGRNTLIIVVLHQPIIAAVLSIISFVFITKGDFILF